MLNLIWAADSKNSTAPTGFQTSYGSFQIFAGELSPCNWPYSTQLRVRDQQITALGSVAVRHIVFFANVYSLCVCLAYACASVFINTTFTKSLPPASSASLGRGGVEEDPESHTHRNALKLLEDHIWTSKHSHNSGGCLSFGGWFALCLEYEKTLTFFFSIFSKAAQGGEKSRPW